MSRTAAKRQAHRESFIYRAQVPIAHDRFSVSATVRSKFWTLSVDAAASLVLTGGLTLYEARRELADWRAARVRELIGAGS